MQFNTALNSGWIQKQEKKHLFSKIFSVFWKLLCLIPVCVVFVNVIIWFVNVINYNNFTNFWNNLFNIINQSFNLRILYILLWVITLGNLILFILTIYKQIKKQNKLVWVNLLILSINLLLIRLMTINISFVLVKAIFEVLIQFAIWFVEISRIQKQLNHFGQK